MTETTKRDEREAEFDRLIRVYGMECHRSVSAAAMNEAHANVMNAIRTALAAAQGKMGEHMTFIVDPSQSIDEVLPADRRWVIANAISLIAGYRNCKASETKETMQKIIDYLRAALATAPEKAGEPVAWMWQDEILVEHGFWTDERARDAGWNPLYTAPPPASTKTLTDAEILNVFSKFTLYLDTPWQKIQVARAIIAATEGK